MSAIVSAVPRGLLSAAVPGAEAPGYCDSPLRGRGRGRFGARYNLNALDVPPIIRSCADRLTREWMPMAFLSLAPIPQCHTRYSQCSSDKFRGRTTRSRRCGRTAVGGNSRPGTPANDRGCSYGAHPPVPDFRPRLGFSEARDSAVDAVPGWETDRTGFLPNARLAFSASIMSMTGASCWAAGASTT